MACLKIENLTVHKMLTQFTVYAFLILTFLGRKTTFCSFVCHRYCFLFVYNTCSTAHNFCFGLQLTEFDFPGWFSFRFLTPKFFQVIRAIVNLLEFTKFALNFYFYCLINPDIRQICMHVIQCQKLGKPARVKGQPVNPISVYTRLVFKAKFV